MEIVIRGDKIKVTQAINDYLKDKLSKLEKYIEDYDFSRKLRNSIDVSSILYSELDLSTAVLDYACDFEDKYDCEVEPTVINTRWI